MFRMKRRKNWEATMLKGTERWQKTACMHLKCETAAEKASTNWCCICKCSVHSMGYDWFCALMQCLGGIIPTSCILRGEGCRQVLGHRNTGYETEGYRNVWGISFNEAMKNQGREGKKGNKWQLLKGSRSLKKANGAKKWKKQIRH